MISHLADPRSPREVAQQMLRRADLLGDREMRQRGLDLLEYARDVEARGLGERYDVVEHSRCEETGNFAVGAYNGGFITAFFFVQFYIMSLFFGLWQTAVGAVVVLLVTLGTVFAARSIRESRQ